LRKIVHLDNELLFLARTRLDSKKNLPDCLNSSQMWLIPPVDDRQYAWGLGFRVLKLNPIIKKMLYFYLSN
jgi:hypothetical protein